MCVCVCVCVCVAEMSAHWIAVCHCLDLFIVLTLGQSHKTIRVEFTTSRVELLPVILGELCAK